MTPIMLRITVPDPEGDAEWNVMLLPRRMVSAENTVAALDRVAADNRLASGWTVESAVDRAWARIQPSTWDQLVGMRGWDPCASRMRLTQATMLPRRNSSTSGPAAKSATPSSGSSPAT